MRKILSVDEKIHLIKRIQAGEKISQICKQRQISRAVVYQWIKKYYRAGRNGKKRALAPHFTHGSEHWKTYDKRLERRILHLAIKYPSSSPQKIAKMVNRSPYGIWSVLKKYKLNTLQARTIYAQREGQRLIQPKSVSEKLSMMKRREAGEKVASLCRDFYISRTSYYKWYNRYSFAQDKLKALHDTHPKGENHWRFVPGVRELILKIVIAHPEFSVHKISAALKTEGEKPLLSSFGVHTLLKRLDLTTYQKRLAYVQAQRQVITPVPKVVGEWRIPIFGKIPSISAIPPPFWRSFSQPRALLIPFSIILVFSSFLFLIINTVLNAQGFAAKIGMLFSFVSLLFGMLFFLYSLKYYLTIAVVLSFSRRSEGQQEEGQGDGFLSKLFGISIQIGNRDAKNGGRAGLPADSAFVATPAKEAALAKAGGLRPDLSEVHLKRHPFVSIHLTTYNEKRVIERLLTAVTSMEYSHLPGESHHRRTGVSPAYEVVIVDDSTDETTGIISNIKDQISKRENAPALKLIHRNSRDGFKGGALREALRASSPKAEFVIVFDADFIPYPDTITQFLKYFQSLCGTLDFGSKIEHGRLKVGVEDGELNVENQSSTFYPQHQPSTINHLSSNIAAIQGYQSSFAPDGASADKVAFGGSNIAAIQGYQWHVLNKSENWVTRGVRSEYAGSYVIERSGAEIYSGLKQIAGSVYMIRRAVLDEIGWETSITEDFELTLKLYEKGYKVVYTPYIQAPAEAVSTIKRLVRQRMRWAEGHSHNIKRMFIRLLFGRWEQRQTIEDGKWKIGVEDRRLNVEEAQSISQSSTLKIPSSTIYHPSSRIFISSPLTFTEKLEFLYLSPYYLQAFFFIIGTFSWFIAEVVFQVRLPFWTEVWGWSLVFTNLFALPLMNMVGLFLEEAEERDYMGLVSFVVLSYIVAPFQAYAAIKGFLEDEEGPWFRTPKTGKITDVFTPGRFYRYVFGIFGRPAFTHGFGEARPAFAIQQSIIYHQPSTISNPYLSLSTANNSFSNFNIRRRHVRWVGNTVFTLFIFFFIALLIFSPLIPMVSLKKASASSGNLATVGDKLHKNVSNTGGKDGGEITTPRSIILATSGSEKVEFIFHKEPRVRIKLGHKEIEITTLEIPGLGKANPQKSTMYGSKRVVYEEIFPNVDLQYEIKGELEERFIIKKRIDMNEVTQSIKLIGLKVLSSGSVYGFYDENGNSVYGLKHPYMYQEKEPQLSYNKTFALDLTLTQAPFGYTLKKSLQKEAKDWLSDPKRIFPVVLDPGVIVSSNIDTTDDEANFGGNQRKLYYHASMNKYYAIYKDQSGGGAGTCGNSCVVYYKYCDADVNACTSGSNWSAAVAVSPTDTDNHNPSLWYDATLGVIWVAWGDNSTDGIQFRSITPVNGQTDDTLGTSECATGDILSANGVYSDDLVGITIAGDGTSGVVWSDIDADANNVQTFTVPAASCSTNPTYTSPTGTPGYTALGRWVAVPNDGTNNTVTMVWQDDGVSTGLQANELAGTGWGTEFTIKNAEGTNFSVTKDSAHDLWILHNVSATVTDLYSCATQCDVGTDVTDRTDPWNSGSFANMIAATITYGSTANDLILSVIKDTSEQAYYKQYDIATNGLENGDSGTTDGTSYGFTAGDLGMISSMYDLADIANAGVVLRQNTNYEFATVPEKSLILLLFVPFLPALLASLRSGTRVRRGRPKC